MSKLWQLIQGHLDEYGVREAEFARRMGTSPQTLNSWKNRGMKKLPEQWLLVAAAREARTTYRSVIFAALEDVGYWPESAAKQRAASQTQERDGHVEPTPIEKNTPKGEPEQRKRRPARVHQAKRKGPVEGSHKDSEKSTP